MPYSLAQFPSILESDRQALAARPDRIVDTDRLLERAGCPASIRRLAQETGIPYERLSRCASLADLVRVKGVGPVLAEMLVGAHAEMTAQQLAQADPLQLHEKLAAFLTETGRAARAPSPDELQQVCIEAGELRPRLSLRIARTDPHFRRDLFAKAWKSLRRQALLQLGIISGMFVLPVLLMVAAVYLYFVPRMPRYISAYEQISRILQSAQRLNYDLTVYSTLVLAAIMLGAVMVMFLIYHTISFIQETWLVLLLFPSHALQTFYKQVNSVDEKKQNRNLWRVVGIFTVILALMTLVGLISIVNNISMEAQLKAMAWLAIPGGSLAAVLAFLPDLRFTLALARRRRYSEDSVKRLCVYRIFILMLLPLMVVLLVKVFLPLTLSWHERIYQDRLIPAVTARFMQNGQQLRLMPSTDAGMERDRQAAIALVEKSMPATLHSIASSSIPTGVDLEGGISAALNMVVWLAITAFVMYFVVPYLILGGWQRGIFYMIVIALSYFIGEQFVEYAPAWFALPETSLSRLLVAMFFVFITTLFFDWVFGLLVNRRTACPACQAELDQEARYCYQCGFQQERS